MADDALFLTLVEDFRAALGGHDLTAPMDIQPLVPESVGEKRNRAESGENKIKPIKKGRSGNEWLLIYTLGQPKKQRYMYNISDVRVADHVHKGRADGLFIKNVTSSSNLWGLILDAATGYTSQVYNISSAFLHKEWIIERWSKNFFITALAGADNGSAMIVMSQGPEYTRQSYKISRTFPFKWLKKKWRQGFFVTSIGTCSRRWAVVVSSTSEFLDQIVELDCTYPTERLQRLRGRGLQITAVANTQDQAAVVLSTPRNGTAVFQEVMTSPSFPSTHVKEHWSRQLYVSSMSYGRTNHFENKAVKFAITRSS